LEGVKSILTYSAETWRTGEVNKKIIMVVQMDSFRRSVGISRKDKVWNDEIRLMGVDRNSIQELQSQHLIWYGHVQRMVDNRLPKQAMQWKPPWRKKTKVNVDR
jgi:hypothetical protein